MATQPTSLPSYLLQANEGKAVWFRTTRMTIKATKESTGGALSLIEVLAAPDSAPPRHVHYREDEMFSILYGSFLFKLGDELFEAGPGSFVLIPRGIPHSFKNVGETVAKYLVYFTPAGLDQYFLEVGTPALEEGLRPQPFD